MLVEIDKDKLHRARAEAGLSQLALAIAADVGTSAISALESGQRRRVRMATAQRIAAALGCTTEGLAPDPPSGSAQPPPAAS